MKLWARLVRWWWAEPDPRVSDRWLTDLRRQSSRIEFHGPRVAWPLVKDE